jgi:methylthioribulose-1-phosphate dehydratase
MLKNGSDFLHFEGYEMQKSIHGCSTHLDQLKLTLFENSQDIQLLAAQVRARWSEVDRHHSLYLRGHGIYCWSNSIFKARAALEGWEFLFEADAL